MATEKARTLATEILDDYRGAQLYFDITIFSHFLIGKVTTLNANRAQELAGSILDQFYHPGASVEQLAQFLDNELVFPASTPRTIDRGLDSPSESLSPTGRHLEIGPSPDREINGPLSGMGRGEREKKQGKDGSPLS